MTSNATTQRATFTNEHGEELVGILDMPKEKPIAFALFAHCFTCSKDLHVTKRISRALAERSIATLRVDFTGLGESEGEFAGTTFSSNIDDLIAAAAHLESEYEAPSLLIGHSLGGAAVISACARLKQVRAIATIGAPSDPAHVSHLFTDKETDIRKHGEAEVSIGGRPFRISATFLDDLAAHALTDVLAELKKPLLIMHAPGDKIVSVDHARKLFEAAFHPKSFISLDDADHLLSKPRDARYAAEMIAAWAGRYLTND
jgi:fermentation-respiration switch protein FrsA (DUF1100 family)